MTSHIYTQEHALHVLSHRFGHAFSAQGRPLPRPQIIRLDEDEDDDNEEEDDEEEDEDITTMRQQLRRHLQ